MDAIIAGFAGPELSSKNVGHVIDDSDDLGGPLENLGVEDLGPFSGDLTRCHFDCLELSTDNLHGFGTFEVLIWALLTVSEYLGSSLSDNLFPGTISINGWV